MWHFNVLLFLELYFLAREGVLIDLVHSLPQVQNQLSLVFQSSYGEWYLVSSACWVCHCYQLVFVFDPLNGQKLSTVHD